MTRNLLRFWLTAAAMSATLVACSPEGDRSSTSTIDGGVATQDEVIVPPPAAQPGDSVPAAGNAMPPAGDNVPPPGDIAPPAGDAAPSPGGAEDIRMVIPAAYVGQWDADQAACRRATNEMRLVVTADRLRFYEGSGSVIGVRPEGRGLRVTTDHEAEGTRERRSYLLSVNDAGDRLSVVTPLNSTTRVRCASS